MSDAKGYNLATNEYVGCTAQDVNEISVCQLGTPDDPIWLYFVKITINNEDYAVWESFSESIMKTIELAEYISYQTEEMLKALD